MLRGKLRIWSLPKCENIWLNSRWNLSPNKFYRRFRLFLRFRALFFITTILFYTTQLTTCLRRIGRDGRIYKFDRCATVLVLSLLSNVMDRHSSKDSFSLLALGLIIDSHLVEIYWTSNIFLTLVFFCNGQILSEHPYDQIKLLEVFLAVQSVFIAFYLTELIVKAITLHEPLILIV